MKVAIICIAKNEEKYIKEWSDYHLNLGFDNIFICDNDEEDIISKILDNERIKILNYRNINNHVSIQSLAYTEVFNTYKKDYDWITFIDIDEFIVLDNKYENNIKNFLSDKIFDNADIIRLHWKCFSDGNILDVVDNDYSVFSRFIETYDTEYNKWGKSFLRTSSINGEVKIKGGHGYFSDKKLKAVNAIGEKCLNFWSTVNNIPLYENAWINHYPTKTIGEYVRQKYFRGGPNHNNGKYSSLKYFFKYNDYTLQKEDYGKLLIKRIITEEHKLPPSINIGYRFKRNDMTNILKKPR